MANSHQTEGSLVELLYYIASLNEYRKESLRQIQQFKPNNWQY